MYNLQAKLYQRYVCIRKKHRIYRVWYCPWFQVSSRVLGLCSKGGTTIQHCLNALKIPKSPPN